jgi:hypothetical protein
LLKTIRAGALRYLVEDEEFGRNARHAAIRPNIELKKGGDDLYVNYI